MKKIALLVLTILIASCTDAYLEETEKNYNDMALSNTGISISAVKNALGASTNDVGLLCTHPNINRWSRWKPIRSSKLDGITEADIVSAKSGLVVPSVNGYANIINYYRSNPNFTFPYNKPRGGTYNEFYRLGDFRNYDSAAEIFYDVVLANIKFVNPIDIRLYTYLADEYTTDLNRWINWHFLDLDHLNFGVIITKKDQSTPVGIYYSEDIVSEDDNILLSCSLPSTPIVDTDYEVFAFLGENPGEDDPDTYTFYVLEDGHKSFQFKMSISVNATAEYMSGGVEYSIDIVNNTPYAINLNTVDLMFRYDGYGTDDDLEPLEPFEALVNIGNIVLLPEDTYNISDFKSGVLPELPVRGGFIFLRVGSHHNIDKIIDIVYS